MTYREAYEEGRGVLERHGVPDSELDAFFLLEHLTGGSMNRARYFAFRDEAMDEKLCQAYMLLIARRAKREPLQYITRIQDFCGFSFAVNENVLIPRQDTEVLVEACMKKLKAGMKVLDLCTGSGCIIISLKKLNPSISAYAADLSEKALALAEENAKSLCADVSFSRGDLFEALDGTFDIIVSNPPYIAREEIAALMDEVRCHEPLMALDGGEDGLAFYRRIIDDCEGHLNEGGFLFFECGFGQAEDIAALMRMAAFEDIEIIKDLSGLNRVVSGRRGVCLTS